MKHLTTKFGIIMALMLAGVVDLLISDPGSGYLERPITAAWKG